MLPKSNIYEKEEGEEAGFSLTVDPQYSYSSSTFQTVIQLSHQYRIVQVIKMGLHKKVIQNTCLLFLVAPASLKPIRTF